MTNFYSILYCPIRSIVDERLSIALFVRSENQIFFRYSKKKLNVLKELLPRTAFNLLRTTLRNFESFIAEKSVELAASPQLFETSLVFPEQFMNAGYYSYLAKYSNNLIHFSEAKTLDIEISETVFQSLYNSFIFENDVPLRNHKNIRVEVKEDVDPKIENQVNIDLEITSELIENLVVPTSVWFIGKNGSIVTGEVIDFEKPKQYLENDLREHLFLLQMLNKYNPIESSGKHFLVGAEPSKDLSENHTLWDEVRKVSYLEFLSVAEINSIPEYITTHGVVPFAPKVG